MAYVLIAAGGIALAGLYWKLLTAPVKSAEDGGWSGAVSGFAGSEDDG